MIPAQSHPLLRTRHSRAALIDELIEYPDVWRQIAVHADAAAKQRDDELGRRVFTALRDCSRILAVGGAL